MNLEETINKLVSLGLSETEEMVRFTDEPKFSGYVSVPHELVFSTNNNGIFGQSISANNSIAKLKSIAECIERICLFYPRSNNFIKARFEEGKSFLKPLDFLCFSKEQLRENYKAHCKRIMEPEYLWAEVTDHINNKFVFIPAQLVFLSNDFTSEPIIREQISTGAALHSNLDQALISGTLECIERDSYILAYLRKKQLNKIDTKDNKELSGIINYFRRYGLEPNIFDITSDLGIPTVMVITIDESGVGPAINVGLRSDFNYFDAISGALIESIQCRRITRLMKEIEYSDRVIKEDEIKSMNERYFYWYDKERIVDLGFWLSDSSSVNLEKVSDRDIKIENKFDYLSKLLSSRGYKLLYSDISYPEIKSAGFSVVKVIIPELHPLYLDERLKCLYSHHGGNIKADVTLKPQPFT